MFLCFFLFVFFWLGQGSQSLIGQVVAESIASTTNKREDFFITSKLDCGDYGPDMTNAFQTEVLNSLNMSYVDLILLHFAGTGTTE
jgi:diketogulonate reductase-like aldo/keto reductase